MNIEFHFDFGSPNAYLSHLVIKGIEQKTGEKVQYVPVLLGGVFKATGNASPGVTLAGIRNKGEYQGIETARFLKKHGITCYNSNPFFPVNTLQIMRGAIFAQGQGYFEQYVDEVYRHMWSDPKKMDEADVIRSLAHRHCGVPGPDRGSVRERGTRGSRQFRPGQFGTPSCHQPRITVG